MSKKRTSTTSKPNTDWDEFNALTDEQVRGGIEADPDARPTDEDFWKKAKVVMPQLKEIMTIRLDADVLEVRIRDKGGKNRDVPILRSLYSTKVPLRLRSLPSPRSTSSSPSLTLLHEKGFPISKVSISSRGTW